MILNIIYMSYNKFKILVLHNNQDDIFYKHQK